MPLVFGLHQVKGNLTLVLLNSDTPCFCKQCRSRSLGFWRTQLIWICTVCNQYMNLCQRSGSSYLICWKLEVGMASLFIKHDKGLGICKQQSPRSACASMDSIGPHKTVQMHRMIWLCPLCLKIHFNLTQPSWHTVNVLKFQILYEYSIIHTIFLLPKFCVFMHYISQNTWWKGKKWRPLIRLQEQFALFAKRMSQDMTKAIKLHVHPVKTQISLGILQVWSEASLSTLGCPHEESLGP